MAAICNLTEEQIISFQEYFLDELLNTKKFDLDVFIQEIYDLIGGVQNEDLALSYILLIPEMVITFSNSKYGLDNYIKKELFNKAGDYKYLFKNKIENVKKELFSKLDDIKLFESKYSFTDNFLSLFKNIDKNFEKIQKNFKEGLINVKEYEAQTNLLKNYYTEFMYYIKLGKVDMIKNALYFRTRESNIEELKETELFQKSLDSLRYQLDNIKKTNESLSKKDRLKILKEYLSSKVVYSTNFQNKKDKTNIFFMTKSGFSEGNYKSLSEKVIYVDISEDGSIDGKNLILTNESGARTIGFFLNLYKEYYFDETRENIYLVVDLIDNLSEFYNIFNTSNLKDFDDFVIYMKVLKEINTRQLSNKEVTNLIKSNFDIRYKLKNADLISKEKDKRRLNLIYNNIVFDNENKLRSFVTLLDFDQSDKIYDRNLKKNKGAKLTNGIINNFEFDYNTNSWSLLKNRIFKSESEESLFEERIRNQSSLYDNRYQAYVEFNYNGETKGYFILLSLGTILYIDEVSNKDIFDRLIKIINVQNTGNTKETEREIVDFNNNYFFATKLNVGVNYELELRPNNTTTFKNNKVQINNEEFEIGNLDIIKTFNKEKGNILTESQSTLTFTLTEIRDGKKFIKNIINILLSEINNLKENYLKGDNYYSSFGQFLIRKLSENNNTIDFGQESIIKKRLLNDNIEKRLLEYIDNFEVHYLYDFTKLELVFELIRENNELILRETKSLQLSISQEDINLNEEIKNNQQLITKLTIDNNFYTLSTEQGDVLFNRVGNTISDRVFEPNQNVILGNIVDIKIKELFGKTDTTKRIDENFEENLKQKLTFGKEYDSNKQGIYYKSLEFEKKVKKNFNVLNSFLIDNDFKYVDSDIVVYGEVNGVKIAGEIDLLVVDSLGNYFIIDIKSTARNNENLASDENYSKQLTAYKILLSQQYNINPKKISLGIFLVRTTFNYDENILELNEVLYTDKLIVKIVDDLEGYYSTINQNRNSLLVEKSELVILENTLLENNEEVFEEENTNNSLELSNDLVNSIKSIIFDNYFTEEDKLSKIESSVNILKENNFILEDYSVLDSSNKVIIESLFNTKDIIEKYIDDLSSLEKDISEEMEKNLDLDVIDLMTQNETLQDVVDYLRKINKNLNDYLEKENILNKYNSLTDKYKVISSNFEEKIKELKKQC